MTEQQQPKAEQPKSPGLSKLVEKYSKRWGVSPEEAEKRIEQIMARKGQTAIPGLDNVFPEPLGPVSAKAQDVNQAILSTQMTRRMLNTPPEDIAKLDQKIETIGQMVEALGNNFQARIDQVTSTLEGRRQQEERDALKNYLNEALGPVRSDLTALKDKVSKEGTSIPPATVSDLTTTLENVKRETANAQNLLGVFGYKVEKESISRDDVQKMIQDAQAKALESLPQEKLKERIESQGYKVVGGPITFDQAQQMVMEAYRKGQEESLSQKQVDAVTGLIRDSVKNILDMFKPGVQGYMDQLFTKGGQPSQSSPQPEPSSTGQGSQ